MSLPRPTFAQLAVWWCIAALLLVTVVLIPAVADFGGPRIEGAPETARGRVIEVRERTTTETPRGPLQHERLAIELNGATVEVTRDRDPREPASLHLEVGDGVLVSTLQGPDGDVYAVVDRERSMPLATLALAFAAFVVLTGRMRGLTSLLGLGAALLVILHYVIPGILGGHDPVLIAASGGLVIMIATLYLGHGVNLKTNVALLGTSVSLVLTAVLALLAVNLTRLSGVASEDVAVLNVLASGNVEPAGLLLAGILIGALGVLDDVTVAQSSAVFELRRANPLLGARELYARAMNVGRDHIAATVSTLVLAYSGASLPVLMLLVVQSEAFGVQLNREFVATEVVRSLVGSIGLIAAVPLTTAVASFVAARADLPSDPIEPHSH